MARFHLKLIILAFIILTSLTYLFVNTVLRQNFETVEDTSLETETQ